MVSGKYRFFPFLFFTLIIGTYLNISLHPMGTGSAHHLKVKALDVTLEADGNVYPSGQGVVMRMVVANKGDEAIKLTFPSSQIYDFIVIKGGKEIWRWSQDKMFALMLTEIAFAPGEKREYREVWDQRDSKGNLVKPGEYEIVGLIVQRDSPLSQKARIIIK